MTKITQKDLEGLCNRLNRMTNSPMEPYTKGEDGKFKANPGNYHLDYAYGGVKLVRMCNEGGGINTPISMGYETKREAYYMIHAYISGIQDCQYQKAA